MKMLILAFLAVLSGCASVSTLQTARSLPAKKERYLLGGGYYKAMSTTTSTDLGFPLLEAGYRIGAGHSLEFGGKYTLPGTIAVDGKYQIVDEESVALAVGLGVSYLSLSASATSTSSTTKFSTKFVDIFVPIYVSYDFSEFAGIYLSPRYILRIASVSSSATPASSASGSMVGSGVGIRLGDSTGVFLEAAYMKGFSGVSDQVQVGGALFFGSGSSIRSSGQEVAN